MHCERRINITTYKVWYIFTASLICFLFLKDQLKGMIKNSLSIVDTGDKNCNILEKPISISQDPKLSNWNKKGFMYRVD